MPLNDLSGPRPLKSVLAWTVALTAGIAISMLVSYATLARALRQADRDSVTKFSNAAALAYHRTGTSGLKKVAKTMRQTVVRLSRPDGSQRWWGGIDSVDDKALESALRDSNSAGWIQIKDQGVDRPLEIYSLSLGKGARLQVVHDPEAIQGRLTRYRLVLACSVAGLFLLASLVGVLLATSYRKLSERIERLATGTWQSLDHIAHDLRTPLQRLRLSAESALQVNDGNSEAACREALAECSEEAERITELLESMMDISEAESGAMRLNRRDVSLDALLRESLELYQHAIEAKGVRVFPLALTGLHSYVDPQRVRQALANLLDNALKFTRPGGEIELRASSVPGGLTIVVRDTGSGIAAADLPHIWDRLYRGDSSRGERGMGLGLSLVKAIALAHGGHVSVSSHVGTGSTFTLLLPRAAAILAKM